MMTLFVFLFTINTIDPIFADAPIEGEIIMQKNVFDRTDENVVADILIGEHVFDFHSVHIAVIKDGIGGHQAQ